MPFEFLAFTAHAIPNSSRFGAHLGVSEQLLHLAHPVGPLTETLATDRSSRATGTPEPVITRLPRGAAIWATALHFSRPLVTLLHARVTASKTTLALPLPALLTLTSLLPLLVLLLTATLLALASILTVLFSLFAAPFLLVELLLPLTGLRLTLAPSCLRPALSLLPRIGPTRIACLAALLILRWPAFRRRSLALSFLAARSTLVVTRLPRGRARGIAVPFWWLSSSSLGDLAI
jgi:hypothetical protein